VTAAIEQDTPAGAAEQARARNRRSSWRTTRPEDRDWLGGVLGARCDNSPIVIPDGPPPADELECYTPSSVPGGRAPHLWLDGKRSSGSSLFDRLGLYFTLLRLPGAPADTARLEAAARKAAVPLTVVDVAEPRALELYQRKLTLIRPDQHIAWRGDELPHDVDALIATVAGRATT
jgi:hypothetical protein